MPRSKRRVSKEKFESSSEDEELACPAPLRQRAEQRLLASSSAASTVTVSATDRGIFSSELPPGCKRGGVTVSSRGLVPLDSSHLTSSHADSGQRRPPENQVSLIGNCNYMVSITVFALPL